MKWKAILISVLTSGGIIGAIQLVLHFIELFLQRPKIKCKLDKIFDSFWEYGDQISIKSSDPYLKEAFKKSDVVVLSLDISNPRNTPVTLDGFYYINPEDGDKYPAYTCICIEDKYYEMMAFYDEKGKHPTIPLMAEDNKINIPYKLEGNDMVKVSIVFTLEKSDSPRDKKIKFIIDTPKKSFKYRFDISYSEEVLIHKKIGYVEAAIIERNKNQKNI